MESRIVTPYVFPVHAEESKEISELKIEIQKKEDELKELKSKLNDLTNEQGYSIIFMIVGPIILAMLFGSNKK